MALEIEFTNAATQRRRYRFAPRKGGELGWWRIEEEYSEGEWHPVGKEVVTDVAIETDGELAAALDDDDQAGAVKGVSGP